MNCPSRSVLGTNSSEGAELSIICQALSVVALVNFYAEVLG
jgi:hypothetical protein